MTKLITNNLKLHVASSMVDTIDVDANNVYYVYVGQHLERSETVLPTPTEDIQSSMYDIYRNMIFGKKITSDDACIMAKRINYVANTIYDMYDDDDPDLFEKDYFVMVDENAYKHVYKCLDNNLSNSSTVEPQYAHVTGSNTTVYQTSDGYRWKYMYSISRSIFDKFSTDAFIPVVENPNVQGSAVKGSINVIKIIEIGRNYNNYTSGTFLSSDVRVGGNNALYRISNTDLSQVNGFFTGCMLYITGGTGSGEYREITDYFSNAIGAYVSIASAFANGPTNGTTWEINPTVKIYGDGTENTNAVARALVNALAANSIYRVEMLNPGANYKYAVANVVANATVGVIANAALRVILPPKDGHGANAASELGAHHVGIGINFNGSESNTIPVLNTYEKVGIIRNPFYSNVLFKIENIFGTFTQSERIYEIDPIRFNTNATVNTTSVLVTVDNGDFENQITAGDRIYLKSGNGINHMITTVASVVNSSTINIASNGYFACTETEVYWANTRTQYFVANLPNADHIYVSNVSGCVLAGSILIGNTSGAKAEVNNIFINDEDKCLDSFVQMYKYKCQITSGTFEDDEPVYQGTQLANSYVNAYFHSLKELGGETFMYLSDQIGIVNTSASIEGAISGATAVVVKTYRPELVQFSGDVLSIENIDTVTRSNTQSETFKLIFEF
jgi:hypothetical protein